MQYIKFQDAVELSRLGMGAMRLPVKHDEPGTPIDYERAQELIDHAIGHGVNYFDTAYIYHNGESEVFLGKALSRYPRESYYIADKWNAMANPDYAAQFKEQLTRLNTDYIDFYMIHSIQDPNVDMVSRSGCIGYFESLKAEGKIKYFGFSFHGSPDGMRRMLEMHKWDFVQIQLNYFDWAYGDAKELYELLARECIPVMVMEPVRGGRLASLTPEIDAILTAAQPGRSVASWAMRWLMDLPQVTVVLSGMTDITHAVDNVKTFAEYKPLDECQKKTLAEALEIFRPLVAVACTNCRYCVGACPKGLDIPRIISVYNEVKLDHAWRVSFLNNLPFDSRPDACTGCGSCIKHCPQGFDIPSYMKELSALNEQMEKMMRGEEA